MSSKEIDKSAPYLPPEILEQIFQYTSLGYHGQLDLRSICLVSRSWYGSCIKKLYHSPSIIGKNFDSFVATLCPSVNANIRRTELALFVHRLDMSRLVYSGSKSLTARVLGRVKGQLEVFIAPAATFSLLAFSALAKCQYLRVLNLEYVIEKIDAVTFLRTVSKLSNLENLALRMAWVNPRDIPKPNEKLDFPKSLKSLTISGICEPPAEVLLYKALGRSKVNSLTITIGGESRRELSAAIYYLKPKKINLDVSARAATRTSDMDLFTLLPDVLHHCVELEELSIPLICFQCLFFTTTALASGPIYALRKLTIHHSSMEMMDPLFSDEDWDQLVVNILSGHLQYLEEVHVLDRKDVVKFEQLDDSVPGRLDQLDQALFDERLENSGLFLAGRPDFS